MDQVLILYSFSLRYELVNKTRQNVTMHACNNMDMWVHKNNLLPLQTLSSIATFCAIMLRF